MSKPSSRWHQYFLISRPRFWPYLLGPFVIGAVAGQAQVTGWLLALALFFAYPANFIIYGINDVYDYETDKLNPKKRGYEGFIKPQQRWNILRHALTWIVLGYLLLELVPGANDVAAWGLVGFYFFGVLYSMPPVRAKTKPFMDSVFNILYVFPAVVSYGLATQQWPAWELFVAAGVWCMAMHAYSAVPDIKSDAKAGLRTVATVLGARGTLLFCAASYALAAVLSAPWLGWFSWLAGGLYMSIMAASFARPNRKDVFRLYKHFPLVNVLVGMALFFVVALR